MRWWTLGFTFPTLLSGRKANLLGSNNVGEVNPNVHHLILVSTLHTFLFFEFFCYYLSICPYTKPWISASTCLWRMKSYTSIHHRNSSLPGQPKTVRSCCLARKSWFFCKVQRSSTCLASWRPFTAECARCHGSLREPGLIQAGSVKVLYISSLAITQCQASSKC